MLKIIFSILPVLCSEILTGKFLERVLGELKKVQQNIRHIFSSVYIQHIRFSVLTSWGIFHEFTVICAFCSEGALGFRRTMQCRKHTCSGTFVKTTIVRQFL